MAILHKWSGTRGFMFHLYGGIGMLQTVTLYKRGDDQLEGTVTTYSLYPVRWSRITKSGQPIQGDMSSSHGRKLHIPREVLDPLGIWYINVCDQFKDEDGALWQPESPQSLTNALIGNHLCIDCLLVEPGTYGNPQNG